MFKYLLLVLSLFILGCSTDEGPDLRARPHLAKDAALGKPKVDANGNDLHQGNVVLAAQP